MLSKNIELVGFEKKIKLSRIRDIWTKIEKKYFDKSDEILNSLSKNFEYSFDVKEISKFKKFKKFKIFGMGGSILGAQSIYSFLNKKIKKKFIFIKNLDNEKRLKNEKDFLNIVISKSGNTLETITNLNVSKIKKNCIFITENKKSYLRDLAFKMQAEIIDHNKFIGGRYSVLSETGMLPSIFMGLNPDKFKRIDTLIKKKTFVENLITNVSSIMYFHKKKQNNSIVLNYDNSSNDLFFWYQQLVAESLGKKKKGLLPIISNMPKDNHSVMQLYLDGFQNNFYTFFYVDEKKSKKLNNKIILPSHKFLKNKSISKIIYSQKKASENIFLKKNIPFRSFEVKKRDEKTLGELFSFFILETILLGKCLKLNPYDQPSVELIKKETKRILL